MRLITLAISAILITACAQTESTQNIRETQTPGSGAESDLVFLEPEAQESFEKFTDDSVITLRNSEFESARRIEREIEPVIRQHAPAESVVGDLANEEIKRLFPLSEFRHLHTRSGKLFQYVTFQQTYNKRDVVGAKVVMRIDHQGDWVTINSSAVSPNILSKLAEKTENVNVAAKLPEDFKILERNSVVYPRIQNRKSRAKVYWAQELVTFNPKNSSAMKVWIDEVSEKIVGIYDPQDPFAEMEFSGSIYTNTPEDRSEMVAFPFVSVSIGNESYQADAAGRFDMSDFLGMTARIEMINPYFAVIDNAGPDNLLEFEITSDVLGQNLSFDQGSSVEERNIYYWLEVGRDYVENDLNFKEIDSQLTAMANFGNELDNAFFHPLLKTLAFGQGKEYLKNTAHYRDIVLHEYGHAVTHWIYGIKTSYEFRAMNEAFSDYLAATITNDPLIAEGAMRGDRKFMRTLDNQYHYDTYDRGKSFHRDGQMFSGALWRIRQELGQELADSMIHEARLAQASTVLEFYRELRLIDEAQDDGDYFTPSPHRDSIRKAFRSHGLHSKARLTPKKKKNWTLFGSSARSQEEASNCWAPEEL